MSAYSRTSISNQALGAIGAQTISSPTEQSESAFQLQLIYDLEVASLLEIAPWGFARRQDPLAVLKARLGTPENPTGALVNPPDPWLYSYAYPSACAHARWIQLPVPTTISPNGVPLTVGQRYVDLHHGNRNRIHFQPAGDLDSQGNEIRVILCNARQAQLVYTGLVTNEAVWNTLFAKALVGRLAGLLIQPLTGDKTLGRIAVQKGKDAEEEAKKIDLNEGTNSGDYTPDYLEVRNTYAGGHANWWDE